MVRITGLLMENVITDGGIIVLFCIFSCMSLYCCYGICLQCSQTATKGAATMLVKPLADRSGHNAEAGACEVPRALRRGRGLWRAHNHQLTHKLDRGNWRFLSPSPVLGMCILLAFPTPRGCPKDMALR